MSKLRSGPATFLIAGIASFMASLDNLIVTTALPTIRTQFHSTLEGLEWTVNAYTLTFAVLLMAAAILGDRFGRRTVFVAGIALFTLGSALAAMSGSIGMLILARVVQGLGGSVIFPLALTLVVQAFSPERRRVAIAALSGMSGLAIALGPWVGGMVLQFGSWHWVFWLNVPIGLILIPAALRVLSESHGPYTRLDLRGTVLITGAFLGVVYGLVSSTSKGWLSAQVTPPIITGLLLAGIFVAWEWRAVNPIIPPRLFRSRGFTLSNLVALLVQGGMFGSVFLLTQFLQNALHYRPLDAGLRMLPWTVMPVAVVPVAAILAGRFGNRRLLVLSAALQAAALAWFAITVSPTVPYLVLLPAMLAAGAGMGLFFALSAAQTLGFVAPEEAGVASGTNNALRQIGVVLGIAVLSGVFASGGGLETAAGFAHGLRPALWTGAAILGVAFLAAVLTPEDGNPEPQAVPSALPVADGVSAS
jgi:EmrB/QacA subfamily drug resistance transporter